MSKLLIHWMRKNSDGCEGPRQHGKGLTANRPGQWRYRVGDYRILANIDDEIVPILVLSAARRREVY